MTAFLLDTNVLSELERPRPSVHVLGFMASTPLDSLFVSDVVIAEIRFGIDRAPDEQRRQRLEHWLKTAVRASFLGRVLPVTEDILLRWRHMQDAARRSRRTFPEPDLLLAATAAHHSLTVATRDVTPFEQIGVAVLNPWQNGGKSPKR